MNFNGRVKVMNKVIAIFLFAVLMSACKDEELNRDVTMLSDAAVSDVDPSLNLNKETLSYDKGNSNSSQEIPVPTENLKPKIKKKIIKDGRMGINVQELESTKSKIDSLVAHYNGYYANEKLNNKHTATSYELKIRIPSKNFKKMIAGIENGNGEIKHKEINARDVTDQFIDLEIRLANKQNYLARYNDLLKKARTVKDILEIEERVRRIEEEIESTTGRLKYLSDLVSYSTLELEIYNPKDQTSPPRDNFSNSIGNALSNGWHGFVDFIIFFVNIWPIWIIVSVMIIILKKIRSRKKKK